MLGSGSVVRNIDRMASTGATSQRVAGLNGSLWEFSLFPLRLETHIPKVVHASECNFVFLRSIIRKNTNDQITPDHQNFA